MHKQDARTSLLSDSPVQTTDRAGSSAAGATAACAATENAGMPTTLEDVERIAYEARRKDASDAVAAMFLRMLRERHPGIDWQEIGSEDELANASGLPLAR